MSQSNFPLVSIVIPVYNRENLVKKAIESAISQSYRNLEIIIIDNKSTDQTYEAARKYSEADGRVKVFQNAENVGPVNNWIEGIKKATGKYIKILFSDDWLSNDNIEKTIGYLTEDVGLVFTPALIKNEIKDQLYYNLFPATRPIGSAFFIKMMLLTYRTPLSPCCGLFRKEDLLTILKTKIDAKHHDEYLKYGAGIDVLTFLMVAEKYGKVFFVKDTYVHFLGHADSFTYANSLDKYYIKAFEYFINLSKKVRFKTFYKILHKLKLYKFIGYFSNK